MTEKLADALQAILALVGEQSDGSPESVAKIAAVHGQIEAVRAEIPQVLVGPPGPAGPRGPIGPRGPAGKDGAVRNGGHIDF